MRASLLLLPILFGGLLLLSACDEALTEVPASAGTPSAGLFSALPAEADAVFGDWQWFASPNMRCRDGSPTGFGIRPYAGSDKLAIVLDSGGVCFNAQTCSQNRSSYDSERFQRFVLEDGAQGIFSDDARNPFQTWNIIFVPYCTGDVHLGSATDVTLADFPGPQQFVGYQNMRVLLQAIAPSAQYASSVVVTGGGFAATGIYDLVARRLAPAPVHLLADAGPIPPDDDVLTPRLQRRWRVLWNLDEALPAGCTTCFQPNGDGVDTLLPYYAATYPDRAFGLISHTRDTPNRYFLGFDNPNCIVDGDVCRVPLNDFRRGLSNIRLQLTPYPNAGTYYIPAYGHVSLRDDDQFFGTTVEGTRLTDWIREVLEGKVRDIPATPQAGVADGLSPVSRLP